MKKNKFYHIDLNKKNEYVIVDNKTKEVMFKSYSYSSCASKLNDLTNKIK